jgi:hypothetical protein
MMNVIINFGNSRLETVDVDIARILVGYVFILEDVVVLLICEYRNWPTHSRLLRLGLPPKLLLPGPIHRSQRSAMYKVQ